MEAGCDEAGRGCLAGPVVAAAVILPENYPQKEFAKKFQVKSDKVKDINVINFKIDKTSQN